MEQERRLLKQEFTLGFTYTRSTGPVVGRFLAGLKNRSVKGVVASCGNVLVPPPEFDPVTAEALQTFVDVADVGYVQSWCWVGKPMPKHLLDAPFAWAQIQLDGASTPMLHMVVVSDPGEMHSGMRVRAEWAVETQGRITDIAFFVPVTADTKSL